jgi:hypothetical protein
MINKKGEGTYGKCRLWYFEKRRFYETEAEG